MSPLYFIAIIPPVPVCDSITAVKEDFRDRFASKHALRVMPHITLKAPFRTADHAAVVDWFLQIPVPVTPFEQRLLHYGCFNNRKNPVVYIQPEHHPSLMALQKDIITSFQEQFPELTLPENELRFHPHITVGYRDLRYDRFLAAWAEYKDRHFSASFTVDNFHLLQHDRKQWNILAYHPLR